MSFPLEVPDPNAIDYVLAQASDTVLRNERVYQAALENKRNAFVLKCIHQLEGYLLSKGIVVPVDTPPASPTPPPSSSTGGAVGTADEPAPDGALGLSERAKRRWEAPPAASTRSATAATVNSNHTSCSSLARMSAASPVPPNYMSVMSDLQQQKRSMRHAHAQQQQQQQQALSEDGNALLSSADALNSSSFASFHRVSAPRPQRGHAEEPPASTPPPHTRGGTASPQGGRSSPPCADGEQGGQISGNNCSRNKADSASHSLPIAAATAGPSAAHTLLVLNPSSPPRMRDGRQTVGEGGWRSTASTPKAARARAEAGHTSEDPAFPLASAASPTPPANAPAPPASVHRVGSHKEGHVHGATAVCPSSARYPQSSQPSAAALSATVSTAGVAVSTETSLDTVGASSTGGQQRTTVGRFNQEDFGPLLHSTTDLSERADTPPIVVTTTTTPSSQTPQQSSTHPQEKRAGNVKQPPAQASAKARRSSSAPPVRMPLDSVDTGREASLGLPRVLKLSSMDSVLMISTPKRHSNQQESPRQQRLSVATGPAPPPSSQRPVVTLGPAAAVARAHKDAAVATSLSLLSHETRLESPTSQVPPQQPHGEATATAVAVAEVVAGTGLSAQRGGGGGRDGDPPLTQSGSGAEAYSSGEVGGGIAVVVTAPLVSEQMPLPQPQHPSASPPPPLPPPPPLQQWQRQPYAPPPPSQPPLPPPPTSTSTSASLPQTPNTFRAKPLEGGAEGRHGLGLTSAEERRAALVQRLRDFTGGGRRPSSDATVTPLKVQQLRVPAPPWQDSPLHSGSPSQDHVDTNSSNGLCRSVERSSPPERRSTTATLVLHTPTRNLPSTGIAFAVGQPSLRTPLQQQLPPQPQPQQLYGRRAGGGEQQLYCVDSATNLSGSPSPLPTGTLGTPGPSLPIPTTTAPHPRGFSPAPPRIELNHCSPSHRGVLPGAVDTTATTATTTTTETTTMMAGPDEPTLLPYGVQRSVLNGQTCFYIPTNLPAELQEQLRWHYLGEEAASSAEPPPPLQPQPVVTALRPTYEHVHQTIDVILNGSGGSSSCPLSSTVLYEAMADARLSQPQPPKHEHERGTGSSMPVWPRTSLSPAGTVMAAVHARPRQPSQVHTLHEPPQSQPLPLPRSPYVGEQAHSVADVPVGAGSAAVRRMEIVERLRQFSQVLSQKAVLS